MAGLCTIEKRLPLKGGVARIRLLAAEDVESVDYDCGTGCFTCLRIREGCSEVVCGFREGDASYEETVGYEHGDTVAVHRLSVRVHAGAAERIGALAGLADTSGGGMVAVVETVGAGRLLVGYSERFGVAFPLSLVSCSTSTGESVEPHPGSTIAMESTDSSAAGVLTD